MASGGGNGWLLLLLGVAGLAIIAQENDKKKLREFIEEQKRLLELEQQKDL